MDKIKFAQLIVFISHRIIDGTFLSEHQISFINSMVTEGTAVANVPPAETTFSREQIGKQINFIIDAMLSNRKIDAIKAHREITHCGLKESKDAIDRIMNKFAKEPSQD